jgi:hypothetical protein
MKIEGVLREKICPICGKLFVPAPEHIYKVKGAQVCSWSCVCKAEREKEKAK